MQGEEGRIVHTDISNRRGYSDFDAGVAFLCQLTLEEFVQFSVEDTVSDELAALGDGTLCSSHGCVLVKFRCGCQEGTMQIIGLDGCRRKFEGSSKFSPNSAPNVGIQPRNLQRCNRSHFWQSKNSSSSIAFIVSREEVFLGGLLW
jgi:hypothetical protein